MHELDKFLNHKLDDARAKNLFRDVKTSDRLISNHHILRDGREYISFSCNDYLGFSVENEIKFNALAIAEKYSNSSSASRLITGNNSLYDILEAKTAELCGTESALVFSSGYSANIGVISALMKKGDVIITDKLSHSCIIDGAKLSGAELIRFKHNDYKNLEKLIHEKRSKYQNCLIVTESVFSMDGDRADLQKLKQISQQNKCWLMVDFAHDLNHLNCEIDEAQKPDIIMGTYSKALASFGGYIAGSKALTTFLKNYAKTVIFSTALPPINLATSIAVLDFLKLNKHRIGEVLGKAEYFSKLLSTKLEFISSDSQIIPVILGQEERALKLSQKIEDNGFIVHPIRPPTVPKNTSRLRLSFTYLQERKDIDSLAEIITSNI